MIKPNLHLTANQRFALTLALIVCATMITVAIILRPMRFALGKGIVIDQRTGTIYWLDGSPYQ